MFRQALRIGAVLAAAVALVAVPAVAHAATPKAPAARAVQAVQGEPFGCLGGESLQDPVYGPIEYCTDVSGGWGTPGFYSMLTDQFNPSDTHLPVSQDPSLLDDMGQ